MYDILCMMIILYMCMTIHMLYICTCVPSRSEAGTRSACRRSVWDWLLPIGVWDGDDDDDDGDDDDVFIQPCNAPIKSGR